MVLPRFPVVARYLWTQWIRPVALPVLLILSAKSAIADINYVPSGSMQPTLLAGDVVFIDKLAYDLRVPFTFKRLAEWHAPQRGDIVVCFSPHDGQRLVKRVVGTPGDTVEMRQGVLYLNGQPQTYTTAAAAAHPHVPAAERREALFLRETLAGAEPHGVMLLPRRAALRDFGPHRVPEGSYFMLGDHRDNSFDSRFFGVVSRREIIGRVKGVFVSADLERWLLPRWDRCFTAVN